MPIPLLVPALFSAFGGGAIIGALLRQPEINRLKAQVRKLQAEIQVLQRLVDDQNRQIIELKTRYDLLKAYQFVKRLNQRADIRGRIMNECALKEYADLCIMQNREATLTESQAAFYNIYNRFLNGKGEGVKPEEMRKLTNYLKQRYALELSALSPPNMAQSFAELEACDV